MNVSNITVEVLADGKEIAVSFNGRPDLWLYAQEAYDLHQAISAVLPNLVQPFKAYPRQTP